MIELQKRYSRVNIFDTWIFQLLLSNTLCWKLLLCTLLLYVINYLWKFCQCVIYFHENKWKPSVLLRSTVGTMLLSRISFSRKHRRICQRNLISIFVFSFRLEYFSRCFLKMSFWPMNTSATSLRFHLCQITAKEPSVSIIFFFFHIFSVDKLGFTDEARWRTCKVLAALPQSRRSARAINRGKLHVTCNFQRGNV